MALEATAGRAPGLSRLAAWVEAQAGWRRYALAFAAGALASLAMPPAYAVPAFALAFPILLRQLAVAPTGRAALAIGWHFGFGYFLFGLYWVAFALFTDIAAWWWLTPFAVAGLPAVMAAFPALVAWAWRRLGWDGAAGVVAFAALWTTGEWLRAWAFTGFPWNLVGYAWVGVLPMLQTASVVGIYGLGLITVLVASLPALFADPAVPPRRAAAAGLAGLAALAMLFGLGVWRLAGASDAMVEGVRLRIAQPNLSPFEKHNLDPVAQLRLLMEVSGEGPRPTHLIWPETAVRFDLGDRPDVRAALGRLVAPGGALLTGAPRVVERPGEPPLFWNSLIAVDSVGAVVGSYDKAHLVPFGEYMPLQRWIPLQSVAGGASFWQAGPGPRTLDLPGLPPVSPLICYEIIFPGAVTDRAAPPSWLLNLTNDGWYGNTAGPRQHFAISAARAVEEGAPLVRAANTGISGVIDPWGRVVASLPLGARGALDAPLPQPAPTRTLYARFGDFVLLAVLILFSLGALTLRRASRGRAG